MALVGAWREHSRGPGRLPFFGATFQHAQGATATFALGGRVECIDQLHNLGSDLDDILALRLHPLFLLLLDKSELGGEVVRLQRVQDREEEVAVAGGLAVDALVRNIRHDGRLRRAVVQNSGVCELLVARDFDLA